MTDARRTRSHGVDAEPLRARAARRPRQARLQVGAVRTLAPRAALCFVLLVVITAAGGPTAGVGRSPAHLERVGAARFIAAYRAGDGEALGRATSPLYHHELARVGLADPSGPSPWWVEAARLLDFAYVDGVVDRGGFAL